MTPCESFLRSKNGSSILKQLMLITFFIQKYLYLFSNHPLNFGSLKMAEILQTIQLERNLFKIENKITRYSHHIIFLEKYKNNRKYPKGLSLKFNISLRSNSEDLQKSCRNILRNASFKLLDNILTAVSKRIEELKIVRNEYFYALKNNVPNDSFVDICERIKKENKSSPVSIVQRQNSKYQRDHPQNRRFRSSKRRNHNRQRKTIHKTNEKLVIEQAKTLCPDQSAINLSTQKLTEAEKSLLRKGPSFIPNPTDINWFNLKRDFDNFVNKLRYMATKQDDENQKNAHPQLDSSTSGLGNPPPIQKQPNINYRKEKTKHVV